MTDYSDFSLDDSVGLEDGDEKKVRSKNKNDWFKAKKGEKFTVSFMYFHPYPALAYVKAKNDGKTDEEANQAAEAIKAKLAEKLKKPIESLTAADQLNTNQVQFKKVTAYYVDGVEGLRYVPRPAQVSAEDEAVFRRLGDPKDYLVTVMLFYPTDREGKVSNKKSVLLSDYSFKPCRFSANTYKIILSKAQSLKSNDLNIATQDLTFECTNGDYQNFNIEPAGKARWVQLANEIMPDDSPHAGKTYREAVLTDAMALYKDLVPFKAIPMSELRSKLGLSTAGSLDEASASVDDFVDDL